jgi:hypothetical protein
MSFFYVLCADVVANALRSVEVADKSLIDIAFGLFSISCTVYQVLGCGPSCVEETH